MATVNDKTAEVKADAAAEKAYAAAAGETASNKVEAATKPAPARIEAVTSEAKAPPVKKAAAKKAKTASRKTRATKAPVRKPVKAAAPTHSPVTKLKDKIMATKTTDFTATVKTAAADAQTRAKAAYDKLQGYAGEATELAKGNVEAIVESGKILGAGVQDLARGEVEAAKGAFETVTADLKAMVAVKSPAELFKLQGEIARRNFDAAVARASRNAEVSMKLANEAFAPISSRMSVVAEKVSKAA
jgi:phasin family protein